MENKVGDVQPSEAEIKKLALEIEAVTEKAKKFCVSLSVDDRRSIPKPRTGWESVVTTLAGLAKKHEVSIPGASVDDMLADQQLAHRLAPLASAAGTLSQLVGDTVLEAEGEAWGAATAFYSVLSRASSNAPAVRDALQPVVSFFALGKRKKAADPTKS